jgi:hypothetical protein
MQILEHRASDLARRGDAPRPRRNVEGALRVTPARRQDRILQPWVGGLHLLPG